MDTSDSKASCLLSILEPVVRMARANGVGAQSFARLVREALLLTAIDDLKRLGVPVTLTRLCVATGLTRSEVQQARSNLRERLKRTAEIRRLERLLPVLLERWQTDPRFSGPYASPRNLSVEQSYRTRTGKLPAVIDLAQPNPLSGGPLPQELLIESNDDETPSFAELVGSIDTALDPMRVLENLRATGSVRVTSDGLRVGLTEAAAYIVEKADAEEARFGHVARVLGGLARTLATNVYDLYQGPKMFERIATSSHAMGPNDFRRVNAHVFEVGALQIKDHDAVLGNTTPALEAANAAVYGVGLFMFSERPPTAEPDLEFADDDREGLSQAQIP